MAVEGANTLQAVASVHKRLQAALAQARSIKQSTTVEPVLQISSLQDVIDSLQDDITEEYDQNYRFAAVETAARDIFYSLITSTSINEPEFVEVWNLLDILLASGDNGKCAPELVVWLLEELLESQTTEGCRTVFDYLETRRERLAQKDFHKKNLIFLRSCNELLRRLSKAEDASFCGRVFFFLFQTFPLGDKSSVNLRGEFHVENVTTFDETGGQEPIAPANGPGTPSRAPINAPTKPGNKTGPIKVLQRQPEKVLDSNTLYPMFWRLQQSFSVPTRLFKAEELQAFRAALTATIVKFKRTSMVVQTSDKKKLQQADEGLSAQSTFAKNYNPKYLTSKDLFDLELSDLDFQRHICIQSLILLNFLLSLSETAKKRLQSIQHPNKSMLTDFTLSNDDAKWALDTINEIRTDIMTASKRDGPIYDRMVDTVLARDKNWIRWKIESCPSIVRDAIATQDILEVQAKIQQLTRPRRLDALIAPSMDLDFLEDAQGGGLDTLRNPDRFISPTSADLMRGIENDKLDLDFATGDETSNLETAIQNKSWRLMRITRSTKLKALSQYDSAALSAEVLPLPQS